MIFYYINDEKYEKSVIERAKKKFKDFIATYELKTDMLDIITWKNKHGGNDHYIRFVVDKAEGKLYISGDLGSAVVHVWDDNMTLEKWSYRSGMYFLEKIEATSEKPAFDAELFEEDLLDELKENYEEDFEEKRAQLMEIIDDLQICCESSGIVPDDYLEDEVIELFGDDYWEWFQNCGRRYPSRILMWQTAMQMAVRQLEKGDQHE
ncbi:MAG: hypothetical protein J6N21_13970 [Butyrivibrio sp.]|nr:hypothetical protein [Butyrivibrio sp.]